MIRDTIAKMNMVAIGGVVLTRREHIIALESKGRGLVGLTLRYPYEVRDEKAYFEDIPDVKLPKDMLDLAAHIVETKSGHFDPAQFEDGLRERPRRSAQKERGGRKDRARKDGTGAPGGQSDGRPSSQHRCGEEEGTGTEHPSPTACEKESRSEVSRPTG